MGKLKIVPFALFFVACFLTCTSYELKVAVEKLRTQIELEMKASLFYQTYAHYFENSNQALHGFARYFYDQSLEEKKHADKLMTYMNKRGVSVETLFQVGKFCPELTSDALCKVVIGKSTAKIAKAPLLAIQDALDLEKKVYDKLAAIAGLSDAQLSHFIEHEYLDEQIESIKELKDFETQLTNIDTNYVGVLLFDRWLLERKKVEL